MTSSLSKLKQKVRDLRAPRPLHAGFTLLEMLVVLVIIGLVAGLVGPQLLGRVDTSKVTAAETQVRMLKTALDTVRLDLGRYPTKEEGLSFLVTAPASGSAKDLWQGPYLSENDVPLDPWGNSYQYEPKSSREIFLFSFGADGKAGGSGIDADVGLLASSNSD